MRYIKLYLYFLRFSISRAMEFRVDFFFRIIMDFVIYLVHFLFFKILYLHTDIMGGFSQEQAMIFVSSYIFQTAFIMTFLANNIWWFPIFVNKGDMDYYLLRPVSSKFFLGLRDIAANSAVNLVLASALLFWSFSKYSEVIPWPNLILYCLFMIIGTYIYFALRMSMILPVFWFHSGRGFDEIFWNMQYIIQRPDGIFTGIVRTTFTTILPFCLICSFPVRFLFEGVNWSLITHILIVMLGIGLFFHSLWYFAIKSYSSASS